MDVQIKNDNTKRFELLSDRWGEVMNDNCISNEDFDAVDLLQASMANEETFVARRETDGVRGLLVEVRESFHADCEDDEAYVKSYYNGVSVNGVLHDGTASPSKTDVMADLAEAARSTKDHYPDLDMWVEGNAEVCMGRVSLQAFVPIGSPLMNHMEEIVNMLNGTTEPSPVP